LRLGAIICGRLLRRVLRRFFVNSVDSICSPREVIVRNLQAMLPGDGTSRAIKAMLAIANIQALIHAKPSPGIRPTSLATANCDGHPLLTAGW
jgi:hypothetical protein